MLLLLGLDIRCLKIIYLAFMIRNETIMRKERSREGDDYVCYSLGLGDVENEKRNCESIPKVCPKSKGNLIKSI